MSNETILKVFLGTSMLMLWASLEVGGMLVILESLACVVMSGVLIGKLTKP